MKLPPDDVARVLRLLTALDDYGADQLKIPRDGPHLDHASRSQVREELSKHPGIRERYLNDNPDRLDSGDLELLRSWGNRPRERYIIIKHLKSGSVLVSDSTHYLVSGLMNSLEETFSGIPLPVMLETVLLPYRDRIVTDGIYNLFNISFGSGMCASMRKDYNRARLRGEIVTSLDGGPRPDFSPPASPCIHRDTVRNLVKATEKLRGGDGHILHPPALGLLRWSTRLASTCLEGEPDRTAIRKQMGQIRKYFHQISDILDED